MRWTSQGSTQYQEWMALRDFQQEFVNGPTILGSGCDECTVDGVHPDDPGSLRIAEALQPLLESILSEDQGSRMES